MRRLAVRYGRHHSQIGELWHPEGGGEPPFPTVVLIHGGYWRSPYTKRLMHRLARAVTREGWAAWNIEYRRLGPLGGGGGWPATLEDVSAAVDHLRVVPRVDHSRVVTCGHSAGGQLALWAAARHRLPAGAPGCEPGLALRGAVSLAGVVDLAEAARAGLGDGAVQELLGGEPGEVADRVAVASPVRLLPFGVPQVLVHGQADTVVPAAMSEAYVAAAVAAGDDARYVGMPGVGHMGVSRASAGTWPVLREELRGLLG